MSISRTLLLERIQSTGTPWDVIIVGGGATGLGAAVDAAYQGYKTLLLEQADFAKGTSGRSTKLVHGGVRYLAQGDVRLVAEALQERGLLLQNAPHLAYNKAFIIPNYEWWGNTYYLMGLKVYDMLAGKLGLGSSKSISRQEVATRLPTLTTHKLYGGVVYYDGQFDDARLAINLAQTCTDLGGTTLNYMQVTGLLKESNKITGVQACNLETGKEYTIKGKVVINATGVFADTLLQMDAPGSSPLIRPSQGIHLVLDRSFMPGDDALLIPKTPDGRVLFALPWHNRVLVGTTDTPLSNHSMEPVALDEEVNFILSTASRYFTKAPGRNDVLSVFAGLRPLAAPQNNISATKEISRSHKIIVSDSGLISVIGGKWTTYRKMGEEAIDKAIHTGLLPARKRSTRNLAIHGKHIPANRTDHLHVYGSDKEAVLEMARSINGGLDPMHPHLPYIKGEVIWAARHEMARTIEDVLARRTRALFLDARAAMEMAPLVAKLLAEELEKEAPWQEQQLLTFRKIAENYIL